MIETVAGDSTLAGSGGGGASPAVAIERGQIIGRYVVLSKLGAGAMGVVFAAYDPQLDRKVALKLLAPRGREQDSARARLQREAQALAKLDHPNVVGVHDVGEHAGQLFVAMEFVEGQTLAEWMAAVERPRDWREVVGVLSEAGRGLAAAHEVGLVHRDFKPDNVMFGDDGRVRVADFGLARVSGQEVGEADAVDRDSDEPGALAATVVTAGVVGTGDSQLTQTGVLMGTPAYMSSEQFEGRPADARSDQFGFCVALYEALYGERPFAGQTVFELAASVGRRPPREPPRGTTVPGWVRKVVVRGLATAPEDRFASMRELLDALARDPAVTRRKWAAALAVAGGLAGGAWGMSRSVEPDAPACAGMDEKLGGVWDDERRASVEAALERTGLSYAAETWVRVDRRLGDYTAAWVAARTEACEASDRGEQSGELLDLRMACLDDRLVHVDALAEILEQADEPVVNDAVRAVVGLPGLGRCADAEALTAAVALPEDPEVARQVAALDERLARVKALEEAGKYEKGMAEVRALIEQAVPLDYGPLMARALLHQGLLHEHLADYEDAEQTLIRAYDVAVAHQMADEVARISIELMSVVGYRMARPDDALSWAIHAKPWSEAAGTDEARVGYLGVRGSIANAKHDYAEAQRYFVQALELCETRLPSDPLRLARALNDVGNITQKRGNYQDARVFFTRSLAIFERELGPTHPEVANLLSNLGALAGRLINWELARTYHERALAIREHALGPKHPLLARNLVTLGEIEAETGNVEQARPLLERALEILVEALGPDHPSVGGALGSLGSLARHERRYDDARDYYERARANFEASRGPDSNQIGAVLFNLGVLHNETGDVDEARAAFEGARANFETNFGPDHPMVASTLYRLGLLALTRGQADEAVPLLERTVAIWDAVEFDATSLAEARMLLARALWDAPRGRGRDRTRAIEQATLAQAVFAGAGESAASHLADADAWLAERGHRPE